MTTFPVEATLDISHSITSECGIEQEGTLDVSHSLVSETTLQIEKALDVSHSLIGETSQELERALDISSSFDGAFNVKLEKTLDISHSLTSETTQQIEKVLDVLCSMSGAYNVKQEDTWIIDETTNVDLVLSHALSHEYGISKICDIVHSFYGGTTYKLDDTWLISKTLDIDLNPLSSLKHSLVASCDISSIFSGIDMIAIDAIMDITPEIQSTLSYDVNSEDNILHEYIGNREYTLVITPHSPPNILSYRATAEWHADYDIAEVRFRGIPSFEVGDYIQIEQEDYYTPHNQWVIFRGVAIGLDKTYKKNFEETIVSAVSNDWYLTKQFCFWEPEWTENLSFLKDVNGLYYVKFFLGGLHYWSNFQDRYGLGDHWEWITGVEPVTTTGDLIPDWEDNWEAYLKVFNFPFGKRKMGAIRDLCKHCDYAFYCQYGHDTWNWGRRLGSFWHRDKVYDGRWPFGWYWEIVIDADEGGGYNDRLLEIRSRESQTTDDTRINRVALGTSIALGSYFLVRREQEGVGEADEVKPIEVYQGVQAKDLMDLEANSSELYETLRKTNVTYEAKLLSLVDTEGTPIVPGMQIRFTGVQGHPEDTFRVKKITQERSGGEPVATTTIEYQDFDLITGGSPKFNEIEMIMNNEEDKMEKGDRILGYPAKNPRSLKIGERTRVDVGEVVAYDGTKKTADIKIYSTNQIVKGVPVA